MPRPRTPLRQAEASGAIDHNPKRFADRIEPESRGPIGEPPDTFSEKQKLIWAQLVSRVPEGVLTAGDCYIVELTVRLLSRLGSVEDEPLRPVEIGHLRACLGSLGLTPADRTRVNGSNEPKKEQDPLAILLGSNGFGYPPN